MVFTPVGRWKLPEFSSPWPTFTEPTVSSPAHPGHCTAEISNMWSLLSRSWHSGDLSFNNGSPERIHHVFHYSNTVPLPPFPSVLIGSPNPVSWCSVPSLSPGHWAWQNSIWSIIWMQKHKSRPRNRTQWISCDDIVTTGSSLHCLTPTVGQILEFFDWNIPSRLNKSN